MVFQTGLHPAYRLVADGRAVLGKAGRVTLRPAAIASFAAAADAVVVVLLAGAARLGYGDDAELDITILAAGAIGLLHLVIGLCRGDYATERLLGRRGQVGRAASAWCLAGALVLALAFLTKSTATYSRGANVALFGMGLFALPLLRGIVARVVRQQAARGGIALRRLMLVGEAGAVASYLAGHEPSGSGHRLVAGVSPRDEPGALIEDLTLAVATARLRGPDDVLLLLPWHNDGLLLQALDAFRVVPAAIHLGTPSLLQRRAQLRGDPHALQAIPLVGLPMSGLDHLLKRALDLTLAAGAILSLAPVMALTAIAIKLDSPGPVFFRQRRIGYNQHAFQILKFRSMTSLEDGRFVRQATRGDGRVTRVGRVLRRTSLDELPQLFNVLAGTMSLVGPRPHALAHDQAFASAHAPYARRHTMRPGITGWAQVNGFRGETDTDAKVAGRVRHDLDYIDSWSIWLDLRILALTVLSPRTFRNAR